MPAIMHVANENLGNDPLCGAVRQYDVDGRRRRPAINHAQPHLLVTRYRGLLRCALAIVEVPRAGNIGRHIAGKHGANAMVVRRQIGLAHAVAVAGFEQFPGAVDTQPLDGVTRPAAAVALARQPVLRAEHAVVALRGDMALEIRVAAEQAKPVLDLPFDAEPRAGRVLCAGVVGKAHHGQRSQHQGKEQAHGGPQPIGCAPLPRGLRRKCGITRRGRYAAVVRMASSYLPEPMPVSAKMP